MLMILVFRDNICLLSHVFIH